MNLVITVRTKKKNESGENLNIDAMFFDKQLYNKLYIGGKNIDPFILPLAVVEHENEFNDFKIAYCMWKLTLVRSPLRILICYTKKLTQLSKLINYLSDVIKRGGLLKDDKGELLIIVGNEEVLENDPWEKYFRFYEWRNNKLQRREML